MVKLTEDPDIQFMNQQDLQQVVRDLELSVQQGMKT